MATSIPPSGLTRYPAATTSSQTAFSLANGFVSQEVASPLEVFPLMNCQGVKFWLGATSSADDNDAFDYRVYIVHYTYGTDGTVNGMIRDCFGYGTATLSAATFIGGVAASSSGRMADNITFTATAVGGSPEGPGTVIQTVYGVTGAAYAPDSDIPAFVLLPHLGWPDGLIFEFDSTTGNPLGIFAHVARL